MFIEKAYIKEFGKLSDLEIELSRSLNVIEGGNESGKSTLAEFIKFVFYGLQGRTKNDALSEKERHTSWQSGTAAGYLVISDDTGRYRIERSCVRNDASFKESMSVIDLSDNTFADISDPGMRFLGIPESVFLRTAYVRQAEGNEIDGENTAHAIENMLFSADESINTPKALEKLNAARVRLQYKNSGGGEIVANEKRMREIEEKTEAARSVQSTINEKESKLKSTVVSIRLNEQKQKELFRASEARKAAALLARAKKHREQLSLAEQYEETERTLNEKATFNGFIPDDEYISGLTDIRSELEYNKREIDRQFEESGEEIEHNEVFDNISEDGGDAEVRASYNDIVSKKRTLTRLALISLGVSAVFWAAAYFIIREFPGRKLTFTVIGVVLTALFAASAVFAFIKSRQYGGVMSRYGVGNEEELMNTLDLYALNKKREDDRNNRLAAYLTSRDHAIDREEHLIEKANALLEKWNMRSDGTFENTADKLDEARVTYSKLTETRAKIESDIRSANELAAAYDVGSDFDESEAEKRSKDFDPEYSDISDKELNVRIEYTAGALKALNDKKIALERDLAVLKSNSEDPAMLESEYNVLKEKNEKQIKKRDALILAYETLEKASSSVRRRLSPRLSELSGNLMRTFTSGKYRSIGVTDKLGLSFTAEDGNGVSAHPMASASRGTQDAAYLALRFSLLEALGQNGSIPMIFDETFASLDGQRLENVLNVLKKYGEGGSQIILLTCQERESRLAGDPGLVKHIRL